MKIEYNNTSVSSEPCGSCGGQAGRRAGGSRVPLEIFSPVGIVCPACAKKHSPELARALELYYDHEDRTERWKAERETEA